MTLLVNGQERSVADGTTLADLVRELDLLGRPIAVERNHEVVPKVRFAETPLRNGDRLEIVSLVGGG